MSVWLLILHVALPEMPFWKDYCTLLSRASRRCGQKSPSVHHFLRKCRRDGITVTRSGNSPD